MKEHYYSEKPTSELRLKKINVSLLGNDFELYTASGVFSVGEIDKGTKLLIEKSIIHSRDILDIGCGYGVVGIALKLNDKKLNIVFTDVNKRAVMVTKKNLKLNNIEAEVYRGNLYEKLNQKFDVILSNPPQHAGHKVCFELIENAKQYLKKKGTLQLVARHNKGGRIFKEKMEEVFGNVKDVAKKGGYRVYLSENFK